jgi:hypothetical protein
MVGAAAVVLDMLGVCGVGGKLVVLLELVSDHCSETRDLRLV